MTDRRTWRRYLTGLAGIALLAGSAPAQAIAQSCAPEPLPGCLLSTVDHKTRLTVRNGPNHHRQGTVWRWQRGEATTLEMFGDPTTDTFYAFCLYSLSNDPPDQIFEAVIPPAAPCRSRACWRRVGTRGFKYRDGQARADGITKLILTQGEEGRAKITLKGRGGNLTLPNLPLELPVVAQLQASNGSCWQAAYDQTGVARNNDHRFGARAAP